MPSLLEDIAIRKAEAQFAASSDTGINYVANNAAEKRFERIGRTIAVDELKESYTDAKTEYDGLDKSARKKASIPENPDRNISVADIDFIERATGCQVANPNSLMNLTIYNPNKIIRGVITGDLIFFQPPPAGYCSNISFSDAKKFKENGDPPGGEINVMLGRSKLDHGYAFKTSSRKVLYHEAIHFLDRPQHALRNQNSLNPSKNVVEKAKSCLAFSSNLQKEELVAEIGSAGLRMARHNGKVDSTNIDYTDSFVNYRIFNKHAIPKHEKADTINWAVKEATKSVNCAIDNAKSSVVQEGSSIASSRDGVATGYDKGLDAAAKHADAPSAKSYLDARQAYLNDPTIETARGVAVGAKAMSAEFPKDADVIGVAEDAGARLSRLESAERGDVGWLRMVAVPERQREAMQARIDSKEKSSTVFLMNNDTGNGERMVEAISRGVMEKPQAKQIER